MRGESPAIIVTLLLISLLALSIDVQPVIASENVYIRVDGSVDPPSSNISTEDNITYTFTDNLLNKSVVVERSNIIIDGSGFKLEGEGSGKGFHLIASDITIRNTRITGFTYGMFFGGVMGQEIINNEIANTYTGIRIDGWSWDNRIADNEIFDNVFGIDLRLESIATIINNNITNNHWGIYHSEWCGTWGGEIIGNFIANNGVGIDLSEVTCLLRDNQLINSSLAVTGFDMGHYNHDIDTSNTIDGKPIYFWKNQLDRKIPPDAGYITLVGCRNITVENLVMTGNDVGVRLVDTTDSRVRNIAIIDTPFGIHLVSSFNNSIYSNNITDCAFPFSLFETAGNEIYHNNIMGDYDLPWVYFSGDLWDSGYPVGGNYWEQYNGSDLYLGVNQNVEGSDGICDTPYISDVFNGDVNFTDRYPLMEPWTPSWEPILPILTGDVNFDCVVDIFDVVRVASIYEHTSSDPKWDSYCDLAEAYGLIDIFDIVVVASHYGEEYSP